MTLREKLKAECERLYVSYDWDMPPGRDLDARIRHVARWRDIQDMLGAEPLLSDEDLLLEYLKLEPLH